MKHEDADLLLRSKPDPLRTHYKKDAAERQAEKLHCYGGENRCVVCETDTKGFATPDNRSPLELVVDASQGFIPLWAPHTTLRWRFNEQSMLVFRDPVAAKGYIRQLFALGVQEWGDAVPIQFSEEHDAWDFEIAVAPFENCNANGCTLARAFFPDSGRHDLLIYPTMFDQSVQEQIETMAHEIGHIFGLRHFFADVSESAWPSEIFGEHSNFSIMNYGADSFMTDNDRNDLRALYFAVWSGQLADINGTEIRLYEPFSVQGSVVDTFDIAALRRPA